MRTWFLILLLLFVGNLQAQILNADGFGATVDSSKRWLGHLDFGMQLNKQADLLISFDTRADVSHWWKGNVMMLAGKFALFRTGSTNLVNGGYGHYRFRFQQRWRLHPELFAQYQLDGIRGMQERILFGANLRWRIFEEEQNHLFMGLGAMYENEYWDYSGVADTIIIPDDTPIRTQLPKINSYITYRHQINELAKIYIVCYAQSPPNRNFAQPRLSTDLRLNLDFGKHIGFSIRYTLNYDANPIVPINKLYYTMINKLVFRF
jgi:hypothetical protein